MALITNWFGTSYTNCLDSEIQVILITNESGYPRKCFSALCFQFNFSGLKCQDFYLCDSFLHFLLVCTNGCEADGLIIVGILEEIILLSSQIMSRRGFFCCCQVGGFVCFISPEASTRDTSKHFGSLSQSQRPCQQWFVVVSQDYNSKQTGLQTSRSSV